MLTCRFKQVKLAEEQRGNAGGCWRTSKVAGCFKAISRRSASPCNRPAADAYQLLVLTKKRRSSTTSVRSPRHTIRRAQAAWANVTCMPVAILVLTCCAERIELREARKVIHHRVVAAVAGVAATLQRRKLTVVLSTRRVDHHVARNHRTHVPRVGRHLVKNADIKPMSQRPGGRCETANLTLLSLDFLL
jgi:hypothetical protein